MATGRAASETHRAVGVIRGWYRGRGAMPPGWGQDGLGDRRRVGGRADGSGGEAARPREWGAAEGADRVGNVGSVVLLGRCGG